MYRPTGGSKDKKANVRIIAATNEDLPTAIAEKRFRADLYQRLKEYTIQIPPLRDCKDDIQPLADFFLNLANEEFEKQVKGFDTEARKRLLAYTWSGNVRELKRVVRMAVLHTEGETVTADTLELDETTLPADRRNRTCRKTFSSPMRPNACADGVFTSFCRSFPRRYHTRISVTG
jgi:two-component system response regulator HydG